MGWFYSFKPYVSVAQRRANAMMEVAKRKKSGKAVCPVCIEGKKIAQTFWGMAWCTNLESYSDFENRLPRGRSYVRNGSVVDLQIEKGIITALVSGSDLYQIQIEIDALPLKTWNDLKQSCRGKVGTLVELLQGKLSNAVMEQVTDRKHGLFPKPSEISMSCSCPDYAGMCKHIAAVMYGVGNRLDKSPDMLFKLRDVDHQELIEQAIPTRIADSKGSTPSLKDGELGDIFGIEIEKEPETNPVRQPAKKRTPKKAVKPTKVTRAKPKSVAKAKAKKLPKKG